MRLSAPEIMALVAAALGLAGLWVLSRAPGDEAAVYRRRIGATMLLAAAAILALFAFNLDRWSATP